MLRPLDPHADGRRRVLSAVVCCGPCSRRTIEQKCFRFYGLEPGPVADRLAELAECGLVDVAGRQALTGDPLWIAVERAAGD